MSVTSIGPATALVGPAPKPRRHALLTIPGVLQPPGDGRWLNHAVVQGYPEGTPQTWEVCSEGTFRVKETGDTGRRTDWDPFGAYFPVACSAVGVGNFDEFYAKAEAALDATLSHVAEEAIAYGVSSNGFFGDADLDVLTADPVSPRVGFSYLENAIGQMTGRQGLIHATPAVVDGAGHCLYEEGGVLYTRAGTPVVSGSGYIGVHPVGGQPGPDETIDWVFATGPVEVFVEDEPRYTIDQVLDRSNNDVVIRAEKYVLAFWDKALQVGVRIDWSKDPALVS